MARLGLAGRSMYALLDDLAPGMRELGRSGATIWVADPRLVGTPKASLDPLDQMIGAASSTLHSAILAAGRDLTRDRLIRAFDSVRIAPEGWHDLNFARNRLTGTQSVRLVKIPASERATAK